MNQTGGNLAMQNRKPKYFDFSLDRGSLSLSQLHALSDADTLDMHLVKCMPFLEH